MEKYSYTVGDFIDRHGYFNVRRGLYDETMARQDRELERFVERLKSEEAISDQEYARLRARVIQ